MPIQIYWWTVNVVPDSPKILLTRGLRLVRLVTDARGVAKVDFKTDTGEVLHSMFTSYSSSILDWWWDWPINVPTLTVETTLPVSLEVTYADDGADGGGGLVDAA